MGKDSLIKSTTKKAGTKKDKKPSKNKNAAKAAGAKTKKESPAKAKVSKKSEPALTLEDLLFKKFSSSKPPEASQAPVQDLSGMTAPPLITSTDPKEVERLRALLEKRFSMEEIAAVAQAPVEAPLPIVEPEPQPPISMEDLLFKQFSEPRSWDEALLPARDLSGMTAPPLITSTDPQEVERLQALLERRFSMEEIAAAAQAPVEAPPIAEPEPSTAAAVDEGTQAPAAETPVQAETSPLPQAPPAPEPPQEAAPAQPPEPQIAQVPGPEAPPAESAAAAAPKPQVSAAPTVEATAPAPAPAPEPAAPAPEQKQEAPPAPSVSPSPVVPQTTSPIPLSKDESRVQPPPTRPEPQPADSGWRSFKLGIAAVLAVFLLIMWGSFNNSGKYFVMPKKGAIEIWRGTFSPTGKKFVAVLHGVEPAAQVQEYYSRSEIFPILCEYYIGKADALLDVTGLPDYQAIGGYLQRAQEFATTGEMREAVQTRVDNIHRLSLTYKAEIDISKGTVASLQSALQALNEVQGLTTEPSQQDLLNQKIATVRASLVALEAKAADDSASAQKQAEQEKPAEAGHAAPEK